jgi:putative tryptophan/tyrosine transport system substrate-binding protein
VGDHQRIRRITLLHSDKAWRNTGFVEGQNIAIEFRWAQGNYDRLPALATDLVSRGVAVLVGVGGDVSD